MNRIKHHLIFTHQTAEELAVIKKSADEEYQKLCHYFSSDLCFFPYKGRLLLNREAQDYQVKEMQEELLKQSAHFEIREYICDTWLVIYMNYYTTVVVLNIISLQTWSSELKRIWLEAK